MTYQEFKDTNYTIDVAAWYAAIDAEQAADVRKALIQYLTTYKMFDALRVLNASKAANKPIHYKAVKDVINACNDDRISVYLSNEWVSKKAHARFDYQYDVSQLYLNLTENGAIDWECPINGEFTPRTIEEIRHAVKAIAWLNRRFKHDVKVLKKNDTMKIAISTRI